MKKPTFFNENFLFLATPHTYFYNITEGNTMDIDKEKVKAIYGTVAHDYLRSLTLASSMLSFMFKYSPKNTLEPLDSTTSLATETHDTGSTNFHYWFERSK